MAGKPPIGGKFTPDALLTEKTCRRCEETKPRSEFFRRGNAGGLSSLCKACEKERQYEWRSRTPGGHARNQGRYRKRHPDRARASMRAWHEKHPEYEHNRGARRRADPRQRGLMLAAQARRRERLAEASVGSDLTADQVRELLSRPCYYCGEEATELDHVIPISRGGAHALENVVPACRSCNAQKADRTPEEWKTAVRARGGDARWQMRS